MAATSLDTRAPRQRGPRIGEAPPSRRRGRSDLGIALVFVAPALIGFVLFYLVPTVRGIYLSFTKFNLLTPPKFNGLDNYVRMVPDPGFWNRALYPRSPG